MLAKLLEGNDSFPNDVLGKVFLVNNQLVATRMVGQLIRFVITLRKQEYLTMVA